MLALVELVDVAPTDDVAEWLIDSPLKFAFKGKFHFILMEDGWSTSQREENFDGLREGGCTKKVDAYLLPVFDFDNNIKLIYSHTTLLAESL